MTPYAPTPAGSGTLDSDGVANKCDNCVNVKNADQEDSNNDGTGNACDQPCLQDWMTGVSCSPQHGPCTSAETGYHYKGIFPQGGTNWACWWHTKNQGWMNTSRNFFQLAGHFQLVQGTGGSKWCYPFAGNPCNSGACANSNSSYFSSGDSNAWGWCGGDPFTSGGFVCMPAGAAQSCSN